MDVRGRGDGNLAWSPTRPPAQPDAFSPAQWCPSPSDSIYRHRRLMGVKLNVPGVEHHPLRRPNPDGAFRYLDRRTTTKAMVPVLPGGEAALGANEGPRRIDDGVVAFFCGTQDPEAIECRRPWATPEHADHFIPRRSSDGGGASWSRPNRRSERLEVSSRRSSAHADCSESGSTEGVLVSRG